MKFNVSNVDVSLHLLVHVISSPEKILLRDTFQLKWNTGKGK